MKNLKKLVLIFTTNHVPELFSASEWTVTYPGVEAGNSNSEHSIPHSSPRGEGRTGEGGGESGNSSSENSIPHPGVEGGRRRSGNSDPKHSYSSPWG